MRYWIQESGSTQILSVSGGSVTEATISGLTPSTNYSIEVAAVNSAGTGVYSDPLVIVEIPRSKCVLYRPYSQRVLWAVLYIFQVCISV